MRVLPRILSRRLAWALAPVLLCPRVASAQLVPRLPISVELRPRASFPVGDFRSVSAGLGAGAGVGFAIAVHAHVTKALAVYGGYDYQRFVCGECGTLGFQDRLPEAGFEAGLEAILPFRLGAVDPWLSVGALFGRRLEIPDGGDGFASEAGTGWSSGVGVDVPLAPALRLRPGIRYRKYSASFVFPDLGLGVLGEPSGLKREQDVASVAVEVGLSFEL